MRQARKLYHELFMISRLVNEVYAGPFLIMLWHNFTLSIIYTYGFVYNIRHDIVVNLFPLHWLLLSFVASFAIIYPFHITSHKVINYRK